MILRDYKLTALNMLRERLYIQTYKLTNLQAPIFPGARLDITRLQTYSNEQVQGEVVHTKLRDFEGRLIFFPRKHELTRLRADELTELHSQPYNKPLLHSLIEQKFSLLNCKFCQFYHSLIINRETLILTFRVLVEYGSNPSVLFNLTFLI